VHGQFRTSLPLAVLFGTARHYLTPSNHLHLAYFTSYIVDVRLIVH